MNQQAGVSDNKMTGTVIKTEQQEQYLEAFEIFSPLYGNSYKAIRNQAIQDFKSAGLPGQGDEEYKYLDVASFTDRRMIPANSSMKTIVGRKEIQRFQVAGDQALVLVFINGIFRKDLSDPEALEEGLLLDCHPDAQAEALLGAAATTSMQAFPALNTAFFNDIAFIRIGKNKQPDRPIHILHLTDNSADGIASFPRNLIVAGAFSKSQVIVTYHSLHPGMSSLCNAVTEVFLDEGASLELDIKQNESEKARHTSQLVAVQKSKDRKSVV